MKIQPDTSAFFHKNIQELRGRTDPEAMKEAAMEMEALFAYEMIKEMRKTVSALGEDNFMRDTYTSMFDQELARLIAERGIGLREMLLGGLQRAAGHERDSGAGHDGGGSQKHGADSGKKRKIGRLDAAAGADGEAHPHEHENPDGNFLPENRSSSVGNLTFPVEGRVSSGYGIRNRPVLGASKFHKGMDIAASEGSNVYPVMPGKVIFSGEKGGYGNLVVVDHGNGFTSRYGHNRVNNVGVGDEVGPDTVIAEVGSTGVSTGPHLHFEVRYMGKPTDPGKLLAMKNTDAGESLRMD